METQEAQTHGAGVPQTSTETLEEKRSTNDSDIQPENTNSHDVEKCIQTNPVIATLEGNDNEKSEDAPDKDPTLVEFDGSDDPRDPKNWTVRRRVAITASMGMMVFTVTFSSSVFSVAIESVAEEFNIGTVTSTLGVALFVLGFVFGPIFFGPASEVYGRRIPLFAGYVVFAIFQIPVAVAKNVETIMICRFIGGFAAAAPLSTIGGALADMWLPVERGIATCAFATGGFSGPVAGPIIGGFVTMSYLGWRWTQWLNLIMAILFGGIGLLVIPETSAQRILQLEARRLRRDTGNEALHAKADEKKITLDTILHVYLMRPFVMLAQEPILALMTAYMSYIYGVVYLLFEAYPVSFHDDRGWNLGVSALPFASFIVGIMMGSAMMVYSTLTNFKRAFIKYGHAVPEERLPVMMMGAFMMPIALFWFGWTSFPSITWVPQVISSAFLGCGTLVTFWQGMIYIIDCYGFYSNSAIAVNTFFRSIAGAAFPLFAPIMYKRLGVPWASSLLGFICLVFMPAPVLFYKYGERIRQRSRFAPTD